MTDHEKAIIFIGIAAAALWVGVLAVLAAGAILLSWWPAKVACVIGVIWCVCRAIAAYYVSR